MTALRRLGALAVLGVSLVLLVTAVGSQQHWLFDFKGGLYDAGRAILRGRDPYHAGFLSHQAAVMRAGGVALGERSAHPFSLPLYPAPANLAVVPLSLLPLWLSGLLFTLLCAAAMPLALWLLDVRDWRCYALVMVSWPFVYGLELGAVGPLLVLGAAAMWRWRNRLWAPALGLASIVVTKVFPFPLAIWMLATRRYRALALTIVLGVSATVAAWAVLGFAGLAEYPRMLGDASFIQEGRSDSLTAVMLAAGLSAGAAQALALGAAALLLGVAWRLARSGGPGVERRSLGLIVIAALTASPIVWDHYLVLLFVPVALLSPSYSRLWLIPLAGPVLLTLSSILVPLAGGGAAHLDSPRRALITVGLEAALAFRLCRPTPSSGRSHPPMHPAAAPRALQP